MNPYSKLGIKEYSSFNEVKIAYKKLSMLFHPDINGATEENINKFHEITEAYNKIKADLKQVYEILNISIDADQEEIDAKYNQKIDELNFRKRSGVNVDAEINKLKHSYLMLKSYLTSKQTIDW